jgi:hypothetical protein
MKPQVDRVDGVVPWPVSHTAKVGERGMSTKNFT